MDGRPFGLLKKLGQVLLRDALEGLERHALVADFMATETLSDLAYLSVRA